MSTAIGIGYSTANDTNLFNELKALAKKFDYGLLDGIEYSELDMKSGLEIAKKSQGWEHIHFLQSPVDREIALAFGIYQELTDFEVKEIRPRFFDFLKQLALICSGKCKNLGMFFSEEWYEGDRIRYSYGDIDKLITFLSMPGNWGLLYLHPESGDLQFFHEIPLVFNLLE